MENKAVNKTKDLILGFFIFALSIIMLIDSSKIKVGRVDRQSGYLASPKGFLVIISSCLLLLSVLLIINALKIKNKKRNKTGANNIINIVLQDKEVFISMAVLVIYVATFRILGFYINSFFLTVILITLFYTKERNISLKDKQQMVKIIKMGSVISITTLVFLHLVFVKILAVSLPRSFLDFL